MKCIVCKNEITEIHISGYIFYAGVISDVFPGFGSSHDLRNLKIGCCDSCLTKLEEEKIIEILKEEVNPFG
jgi:hypothetical protein